MLPLRFQEATMSDRIVTRHPEPSPSIRLLPGSHPSDAPTVGPLVRTRRASRRPSRALPNWIRGERTLSDRGKPIKQFVRAAKDQMLILDAFQESGWPRRIDDPLSAHPRMSRREHLRKTLWKLNRLLPSGSIRFQIEPDGRGVSWVR
jgi:hypothetical protein